MSCRDLPCLQHVKDLRRAAVFISGVECQIDHLFSGVADVDRVVIAQRGGGGVADGRLALRAEAQAPGAGRNGTLRRKQCRKRKAEQADGDPGQHEPSVASEKWNHTSTSRKQSMACFREAFQIFRCPPAPAGRSLFPLAAVAAAASAAAAALFAFCRPDGIDRPSGQRQKNEDRKRFHKGFLSAAEAALRSSVLLRREMARNIDAAGRGVGQGVRDAAAVADDEQAAVVLRLQILVHADLHVAGCFLSVCRQFRKGMGDHCR